MSQFDDALREAMRREQAPEGFAERVMARIEAGGTARPEPKIPFWSGMLAAFRGPQLRWASGFAVVALVIGGVGFEVREQRERAEGERAKEQVMLALRITSGKLRMVQAKVQRMQEVPMVR
jgi:hypothetical protein